MGLGEVKSSSKLRWIVLVLSCLMLVGSYYCFDIPGTFFYRFISIFLFSSNLVSRYPAATKQQMDDYFQDPDDFETLFSLLYSLYAIPNIFLPFFGGFFVDKFGVNLSLLIFTSLLALGQVVVSVGVSAHSWPIIFCGRLIFGLGGENLIVASSALLAEWFRGKELAFSFGVNLAIARLGAVINNILSPSLSATAGFVFACWFGVIVCVMSVISVLIHIPIDRYVERTAMKTKLKNQLLSQGEYSHERSSYTAVSTDDKEYLIKFRSASDDMTDPTDEEANDQPAPTPAQFRDVFRLPYIFWMMMVSTIVVYSCVVPFNNISSSLLLERDFFKVPPPGCTLRDPHECQSPSNPPNSTCPTSTYYQTPLPADVNISGVYYAGQLTFADVDCTDSFWSDGCAQELCKRLQDAESEASVIMSIPYIISAVMCPFIGILIDKYGLRAVIAALGPAILIIVHALLGYSTIGPIGPLVGQGLAYTGFAAVLWPAIPLVVEDRFTGLAFGIATSLLNLGCAVFPLIVAAIYSNSDKKYIPNVEILFIALGAVGLVVGVYINYYDYCTGSILNRGEVSVSQLEIEREVGAGGDEESKKKKRTSSTNAAQGDYRITDPGSPFILSTNKDVVLAPDTYNRRTPQGLAANWRGVHGDASNTSPSTFTPIIDSYGRPPGEGREATLSLDRLSSMGRAVEGDAEEGGGGESYFDDVRDMGECPPVALAAAELLRTSTVGSDSGASDASDSNRDAQGWRRG